MSQLANEFNGEITFFSNMYQYSITYNGVMKRFCERPPPYPLKFTENSATLKFVTKIMKKRKCVAVWLCDIIKFPISRVDALRQYE